MFSRPELSHAHSLEFLNSLYEYDDFMLSISTLADLGCGTGLDTEWWATRTTRDENPEPLNINCMGIDLLPQLPIARKYPNITYQSIDFEKNVVTPPNKFDVLWCHDAFQYCVDPLTTLSNWWHIASPGGVLCLSIPQTINIKQRQLAYHLPEGVYYHHTMVTLIRMLATAGWDCKTGFFQQQPQDSWIRIMVYKSEYEPLPVKTTWHELVEKKLLPESADHGIQAHNYLRQQDLLLPWIDKSLTHLGYL